MTEDDDLLRELNQKADDMQSDINDIQGDVNILSTLNKEIHRDKLIDLIKGKFGRSDYKRLCWYYADGSVGVAELAELIDTSESTIRNYVSEMNREGLLRREENDDGVNYNKTEISVDIGLEQEIAEGFDDL